MTLSISDIQSILLMHPLHQSTLPKKTKTKIRAPTQDELIARALDMEEGNVIEHRNYLSLEEEKRRKARLVRTTIQGPLLRWVSRSEEIVVKIEPLPTLAPAPPPIAPVAPAPAPQAPYAYPYGLPAAPGGTSNPANYYYYLPYAPSPQATPQATSNAQPHSLAPPRSSVPSQPSGSTPTATSTAPPEPIEKKEKVAKNYVVHEIAQVQGARPAWHATMKAMFGEHVKWEELRVYTTKGRPLCTSPILLPAAFDSELTSPNSSPNSNMSHYREDRPLQRSTF